MKLSFQRNDQAHAVHLDRTVMLSQSSVYHEILCDSGCEAVFAEDFFCLLTVGIFLSVYFKPFVLVVFPTSSYYTLSK